jgi:hypothetical protein
MQDPTCPKCASAMDDGFTLDNTYGGHLQAEWVEGEPKRSFWTGLTVAKETRHPITTYRCRSCGYLESYAPAG